MKTNWPWLIVKMERRLKVWSFRWLSRAGRLVLIKSILEVILVYWMSLSQIPKGVLNFVHTLCSWFLWRTPRTNSCFLGSDGREQMLPRVGWLGHKKNSFLCKSIGRKGKQDIIDNKQLMVISCTQKLHFPQHN